MEVESLTADGLVTIMKPKIFSEPHFSQND